MKNVMLAAIGFRAKTGRAIAVVLSGDAEAPQFVWRGEVSLVDPAIPATAQPYHEVMELPWNESKIAVQDLVVAIERAAEVSVGSLIEEMRESDADVRAIGIVGSTPRNLERIGNYHIRAHAAEGIVFRHVLEVAADKNHVHCIAFSEDELKANAFRSEAQVKATLKRLGRAAGSPWRADEQLAARVAWVALTR
jgi:hypothetical protein